MTAPVTPNRNPLTEALGRVAPAVAAVVALVTGLGGGLVFSGISPERGLVEYVELPREVHPYYIATQAHPELRSRPTDPHPLFRGLVGAAVDRHRASELFEVENA